MCDKSFMFHSMGLGYGGPDSVSKRVYDHAITVITVDNRLKERPFKWPNFSDEVDSNTEAHFLKSLKNYPYIYRTEK